MARPSVDAPPVPFVDAPPAPPPVALRIGRTLSTLLTVLAAAAVAVVAWWVLARFAHLLLVLVLALLVAFIFAPVVAALERRRLPRVAAIALAYLGTLLLVGGGLTLLLGPLVAQLAALAGQLPHQVAALQAHTSGVDRFFSSHHLPLRVATVQKQVLGETQQVGTVLLSSTLAVLSGLTSFVIDVFLILVLSFYFLLDAQRIHTNLIRLLPERQRTQAFFVQAAFVKVVGGYIRGQLLMALTIGGAAGLGCWLLGVPYPLVIGLLAGVFELMPMVGPVLGAIPAVVIALFQGFPLVLWVILLFVLIQQIEGHVLGPRIMGHAVGLHPLGALLALLAGVELGGILGALFAVPLVGILYVLAVAVYWQWRGQALPRGQRSRGPSRMAGLARGVVRRRSPGTARSAPVREPTGITTAAATVVTAVGGDTAPRPETLVKLERAADDLRERFEHAENERQAEQTEAVAQAEQIEHEQRAG